MANGPTKDELDAKLATAEARSDAKIARVEGKIDTAMATLGGKIETAVATLGIKVDGLSSNVEKARGDERNTRLILFATIIGSAIALGGLIVGMATYGDALFGRGMNVRDVIHAVIQEMPSPSPPTATKK